MVGASVCSLDQGGLLVGMLDDIQFTFFQNCGYTHVPPDAEEYHSTWVDYPNRNFDPQLGHLAYQRHLRLVRAAEDLGFDGVAINEHHNTQFSMTPSVSVMGGAVVNATSRVRVQVAGVPVNFSYPNRVAEEYAMLDVLSGGRMEYAFPLGTGMEYWSNAGNINPVTARDRFRESVDIIKRIWTEEGPFRYDGDFYTYRYLNPWPRPYQQPHPKMYIVGSGSPATVELADQFDAGYSIVLAPIPLQLKAFEYMRELAARRERVVAPDQLIIVIMVYVADTDEEAMRMGRPHFEHFFSWSHRVPPQFLLPPGYVGHDEYLRRVSDAALSVHEEKPTWDDIVKINRMAIGSPATVADLIAHWAEEAGCSRFNVVLEHSDMPEWETMRSMTLFAREVIPRIRAKGVAARQAADGLVTVG
jgi:alkanesulfonate monooxygenase SsuD/methylene tetrahydromethanopterin reductase-like flavin-dependent oxidoreductase (luciferase family)